VRDKKLDFRGFLFWGPVKCSIWYYTMPVPPTASLAHLQAWTCAEAAAAQAAAATVAPAAQAGPRPDGPPLLYVSFDGTGIPRRKPELAAVKGKGPEGAARPREVKLGGVFTQTKLDGEGRPVRDPDSTTYVGAIESSELFASRPLRVRPPPPPARAGAS
jgi:hypothetical protein